MSAAQGFSIGEGQGHYVNALPPIDINVGAQTSDAEQLLRSRLNRPQTLVVRQQQLWRFLTIRKRLQLGTLCQLALQRLRQEWPQALPTM